VLGIDFGTSSTKIVARLPYEAGAPAFAIPVPGFARAESWPHLWASRLWLAPDGSFSLWPHPHAVLGCALKTALMRVGANDDVVLRHARGPSASVEEAVTAFPALQIRQAKGWLATAKAPLLRSAPPKWSYNLGFPAASLDDRELRLRCERCVAAALRLLEDAGEITVTTVRQSLASVRENASAILGERRAALHPEIAGAIAGFANSTRREDGLYAMVDVGGGTVDCCTFTLFADRTGQARCPILLAQVELLGVEPWRICEDDQGRRDDFKFLIDALQNLVIWGTKQRLDPNSPRWTTGLPLFFIGGGVHSSVHEESVRGRDLWLRQFTRDKAGVRLETLPEPHIELAEHSRHDMHRLAVAIGLSWPFDAIPEAQLPKDIPRIPGVSRVPIETRFVDTDHV